MLLTKMPMERISKIGLNVFLIVAIATLVSCSTTKRLGADDTLYTGVKKIDIVSYEKDKIPAELETRLKESVNVAPNNPLFSPYVRHPFPVGLWVYNNWSNPPSGFKHWLYEKLVDEPVLISDVRPEVRTKMIDQILDNNGYFRGHASFELLPERNKKKARISYNINTGPAYLLDEIQLLRESDPLSRLIDSIACRGTYLVAGNRYCTDSLNAERTRIANAVRNRGYYYFRPEYIEYLADSTITSQRIALRMNIAKNVPPTGLKCYRTGDVKIYVYRNRGGGTPDTIVTSRGTLIQMQPSKLRPELIPECITFREGRVFSVRDMNRTQSYLSRLGIFNAINIDVQPDTLSDKNLLDVAISCTFDTPLEASIELNASSKSNSYLGPGLTFGVTNRNLFGGGEQLNVNLTGAYEWQTGNNRGNSSLFNSYEFGINASLAFPRLIAPKFIPQRRRTLNWTRISLNADLLNRPHFFRLAQFDAAFSYDWRATRYASNTFTPLKLTYTKLLDTTSEFDSIMDANPAIAQSFRSQFIPQVMYSYTYDRAYGKNNTLNWQFTLQEAGNICWAMWSLLGKDGEKKLFNTPFSQFVKGSTQLVYSRRLGGSHWLVTRAAVGAAHAYGNSSQVPYSEQFYVGGANSIRAFTVRSIGPGSYREDDTDGYFDQTGTFKVELNMEYRFPIYGPLKGAMFLDAGNVWLLKDDMQRPGGTLRASTFLKDLALGTGLGLRFDIGMLVVRGDLGIGIHAPYATGFGGYYNMESFKKSLAFHLAIGYPF